MIIYRMSPTMKPCMWSATKHNLVVVRGFKHMFEGI